MKEKDLHFKINMDGFEDAQMIVVVVIMLYLNGCIDVID